MISTQPKTAALSDEDFTRFRDLVRREIGLVIPDVRRREVERVVARTLSGTGLADTDDLYAQLTDGADRTHLESFVGDLTIGETHFFRNRPQFEALERHILPGLVDKHKETRRLRIWSAACSSGEEPYSLAILLKRLIPNLEDWNVMILATDINQKAIEQAQRGAYGSWSFREVPSGVQKNYFDRRGDRFEIAPEVKSLVTFGYLNLVEDAYPSLPTNTTAMDLILCRNVLMYFDDATVHKVAGRLRRSLADDGWLLVAPAEFSQSVFREFKSHNFPGTVAYRETKSPTQTAAERPRRAPRAYERIAWPTPHRDQISDAPADPTRAMPAVAEQRLEVDVPVPPPVTEDLAELEELAMANPEDALTPYLAAKVLAGQLELEAAERWIETTIERSPLFAPGHYLKGLILLEGGRLDDALAALRRSVFSDPTFILGHFVLGGLFARLGQTGRALKALDNALELLGRHAPPDPVPEGDGLTAGRLRELVDVQKELLSRMRR